MVGISQDEAPITSEGVVLSQPISKHHAVDRVVANAFHVHADQIGDRALRVGRISTPPVDYQQPSDSRRPPTPPFFLTKSRDLAKRKCWWVQLCSRCCCGDAGITGRATQTDRLGGPGSSSTSDAQSHFT